MVPRVAALVVLPAVAGRVEARGHGVEHLLHRVAELVGHGAVHPLRGPRPDELTVGVGLAVVGPEAPEHLRHHPHHATARELDERQRRELEIHLVSMGVPVDEDVVVGDGAGAPSDRDPARVAHPLAPVLKRRRKHRTRRDGRDDTPDRGPVGGEGDLRRREEHRQRDGRRVRGRAAVVLRVADEHVHPERVLRVVEFHMEKRAVMVADVHAPAGEPDHRPVEPRPRRGRRGLGLLEGERLVLLVPDVDLLQRRGHQAHVGRRHHRGAGHLIEQLAPVLELQRPVGDRAGRPDLHEAGVPAGLAELDGEARRLAARAEAHAAHVGSRRGRHAVEPGHRRVRGVALALAPEDHLHMDDVALPARAAPGGEALVPLHAHGDRDHGALAVAPVARGRQVDVLPDGRAVVGGLRSDEGRDEVLRPEGLASAADGVGPRGDLARGLGLDGVRLGLRERVRDLAGRVRGRDRARVGLLDAEGEALDGAPRVFVERAQRERPRPGHHAVVAVVGLVAHHEASAQGAVVLVGFEFGGGGSQATSAPESVATSCAATEEPSARRSWERPRGVVHAPDTTRARRCRASSSKP